MKQITIRLGLATKPWQVVEKWTDYDWTNSSGVFENASDIILTWPREENNRLVVEVTHTRVEEASRLIAYDHQGKIYDAEESPGGRGKNLVRRVYRFADEKLSDIRRFEFQRRPYDAWITFKNVSLQSGHRTDVQAETEHPAPPIQGR